MAKAPTRNRTVYFAGAGLSCAFGLPNTAALLTEVRGANQGGARAKVLGQLTEAYKAFYPDGDKKYFVPSTVDFFSSLQAYIDIGAPGLPGVRLRDAQELLRELKMTMAKLLVDRLREATNKGVFANAKGYLAEMVRPGNIVVTTNWDLVIERFAMQSGVRVKLNGAPDESSVLLLKLHGSIDWLDWQSRKLRTGDLSNDYAVLRQARQLIPLPADDAREVVRVRIDDQWNRCWQRISGRTSEPFIVTMYRGKGAELAALSQVWKDAYDAISRAKVIELVGYSLPDDDLEIRTLLRAGLTRGNQKVAVTVRNPAPDVHVRFRQHVFRDLKSVYQPVGV